MNKRVTSIIEEARKLSPAEREELLMRLRDEFDPGADEGTPEEIEAAWIELAEQRLERAERGETTFVPAEEVMAELRKLIGR